MLASGIIAAFGASAYQVDGVTVEQNRSRHGGGYTRYTFRSVDECAKKCASDQRCQAYDYYHVSNQCVLKDHAAAPAYKNDWMSGVKIHRGGHHDSGEVHVIADANGHCKLKHRHDDHVVYKGPCHIRQELAGSQNVFLISVQNVTYHFVGHGSRYKIKRGWDEYDVEFKDHGKKGVFLWGNNKLVVNEN